MNKKPVAVSASTTYAFFPMKLETKSFGKYLSLSKDRCVYIHTYIHTYIHIHMCCGDTIWSKFGLFRVVIWSKCAFLKTLLSKTLLELGFQHIFWWKRVACKNYRGCNKFSPDNNPYLDQIITSQNGLFLFKMCWNTYFDCFLNINQNLAKTGPQKTITFHIWENTGY